MRIFPRYLLFQLPGWGMAALAAFGLAEWSVLPPWVAVLLFLVWIVKDLAIYPWVRGAYAGRGEAGAALLVGEIGLVENRLDPRGHIWVRGQRWRARAEAGDGPIAKGTPVSVVGGRGLTLFVRRLDPPTPVKDSRRAADGP